MRCGRYCDFRSYIHRVSEQSTGSCTHCSEMSWKRLPTFFANIPLKLMPLSETQQKAYETNGTLKQVAFQTIPSVSKVVVTVLVRPVVLAEVVLSPMTFLACDADRVTQVPGVGVRNQRSQFTYPKLRRCQEARKARLLSQTRLQKSVCNNQRVQDNPTLLLSITSLLVCHWTAINASARHVLCCNQADACCSQSTCL